MVLFSILEALSLVLLHPFAQRHRIKFTTTTMRSSASSRMKTSIAPTCGPASLIYSISISKEKSIITQGRRVRNSQQYRKKLNRKRALVAIGDFPLLALSTHCTWECGGVLQHGSIGHIEAVVPIRIARVPQCIRNTIRYLLIQRNKLRMAQQKKKTAQSQKLAKPHEQS